MERGLTTIHIILDRLRRKPLLSDIPFETVVDYVVDFIEIEGLPAFFEEKTTKLSIENYKALLPNDCSEVKAVRTFLGAVYAHRPVSLREATDIFYNSENKRYTNDFTYKINGNIIYTSFESGEIEIVYSAFKVDKFGFPLIPDDRVFFIALENYIKMKHYEDLFEQGKLHPSIVERADREYAWSVGACESHFHKLSYDRAESLGNQWRQILINNNEHLSGYANIGIKKDFNIT